MRHRSALALLAISAILAGCGATGAERRADGKALFAEDCSVCHSVSGVQSPRRQGGDLLREHLSPTVMLQFAREMPVRRRLTEGELKAVADYVVAVERRGR